MNIPTPDHQPPSSPDGDEPVDPRTALIRAAADDELDPAQRLALEEHLRQHPEDINSIQFERRLRSAIATLSVQGPSPEFARRIHALAGQPVNQPDAPALHDPGLRTPRRLVPPRLSRPRLLRIAAAIAILAGSGGLWLAFHSHSPLPAGSQQIAPSHRLALVAFVSEQHRECEIHAELVARRFRIAPLQAAPRPLMEILDAAPDLDRLAASGLEYIGAARCAVPGRGSSVHLVLRLPRQDAPGDARPADHSNSKELVSLFIQQDRGELAIEPDRTYSVTADGPDETGDPAKTGSPARNDRIANPTPPRQDSADATSSPQQILVWRRAGLMYFLVARTPTNINAAREALSIPEPSGVV